MRALAVALLLAGGCDSTRPCRAQTLLLTLTLDAASAPADQLEVDVAIDGTPSKTNMFAHVPGDPSGTIEIDFPNGYPAGHLAGLSVTAFAGGTPIGSGQSAINLPEDCGALTIDVHGGP